MGIKNLAELKRALHVGAIFDVIDHQKPKLIGLRRQVNKVQTNAVYTVVLGQPEHELSTCNGGKGNWMEFNKASHYEFGETIKWFNLPIGSAKNHVVMEFRVIEQ